MKIALMGLDLWDYVNNTETNTLNEKENQRALTCLCLNVKSHCHVHLKDCLTARDTWLKLCSIYEDAHTEMPAFITTNNGRNIVKAFNNYDKWSRVPCFAHCIQLVVKREEI